MVGIRIRGPRAKAPTPFSASRNWGISRARILILVCAVFARIRRLRKSPQYLLIILQGKMTASTNLGNSPQNFHKIAQNNNKMLAREIP